MSFSVIEKDQADYIANYGETLLAELLRSEHMMIPKSATALPQLDRLHLICWLLKVCRRAKVSDRSVFFLALQLIDHYCANFGIHRPVDIQLLGIVGLFMATKLLEITYFDMRFCVHSLGHGKYSEVEIIDTESRIVSLTQWHYTQSTQVDLHHLLLSLLKIRLPSIMSTVLFKAVTIELDEKLLCDLRQTLAVVPLIQLKAMSKIAGMLTFKMWKLAEFIAQDFPPQASKEMRGLTEVWSQIVT